MSNSDCVSNIYLLEDGQSDIALFQIALEDVSSDWKLILIDDLHDFLVQIKECQTKKGKAIVVTDWNTPLLCGGDLITAIRKEYSEKKIPIIVLSGSTNEDTIQEAYQKGANCFIYKDLGFSSFKHKIDRIITYFSLEKKNTFFLCKNLVNRKCSHKFASAFGNVLNVLLNELRRSGRAGLMHWS